MIFTAGRNLERAVNLFAEHDARKLVREGHRGHGKPEVGLPLDLFGQAPRAADKKSDAAAAANRRMFQFLRKQRGGKLPAFNTHGYGISAARNPCKKAFAFF